MSSTIPSASPDRYTRRTPAAVFGPPVYVFPSNSLRVFETLT
ncbi:hypothetical protein [Deinococcus sp. JMULE3]|nr:hypothetical protein [Deinococcus sp. JMULE3]